MRKILLGLLIILSLSFAADIVLTITIPDAYVARFSAVVDLVYPGRLLEDPVPTKTAWAKAQIIKDLKQKVLVAEKEAQGLTEITIQ